MRAIVCLLFASPIAHADKAEPIIYHVSKAAKDKEKLMRVFSAIQVQDFYDFKKTKEDPRRFRPILGAKLVQKINDREYLVIPHIYRFGRVIPTDGKLQPTFYPLENKSLYLYRPGNPLSEVDGESIRNLYLKSTEQTYSYTNSLGAKATVRVLVDAEKPEYMTQDEFIKRLKAGETWRLYRFTTAECRACFGDGKKSKLQGGGSCEDCEGKGSSTKDLLVKW